MAHAHTVLSWYENLTEDEVPPEWMWHLDEELEDWFADVKEAREARYNPGGRSQDSEPEMLRNELTRGRR